MQTIFILLYKIEEMQLGKMQIVVRPQTDKMSGLV